MGYHTMISSSKSMRFSLIDDSMTSGLSEPDMTFRTELEGAHNEMHKNDP